MVSHGLRMAVMAVIAALRRPSRPLAQVFLAYFGAFTFSVAAPLYVFTLTSPRTFDVDRVVGVWFVLVLSVIPAAVLVLVRSAVGPLGRGIDLLVYAGTVLSGVRQIQLQLVPNYSLSALQRMGVVLAMLFAAIALIWLFRQYVTLYMTVLGALSIVLPLRFVWALPASSPTAAAAAYADAGGENERPANTVFVFVFDELSTSILLDETGAIDRAAFPHLAGFADESVWFRQATANYALSNYSINSMLTASYPRQIVDDVNALPEPNLLSELLDHGYEVGFYSPSLSCESGRFECIRVRSGTLGMPGDALLAVAGYYLPQAIQGWLAPNLRNRAKIMEGRMLSGLGVGPYADPGRMSFIHLLIAHFPFTLTPEGKLTAFADYAQADFVPGVDIRRTLELYKNQARYLDQQFGNFLAGLKKSGAWDRSVILVTADHGACWKPGCMPRYGRLDAVEPSLARVPMMIHAPSLTPQVVDDDYQNVDLFPTLLHVLSLDSAESEHQDGRAAFGSDLAARRRPFFVRGGVTSVDVGNPPRRVEVGIRERDRP